jgi:hypothetical protein
MPFSCLADPPHRSLPSPLSQRPSKWASVSPRQIEICAGDGRDTDSHIMHTRGSFAVRTNDLPSTGSRQFGGFDTAAIIA